VYSLLLLTFKFLYFTAEVIQRLMRNFRARYKATIISGHT